MVLWQGMCLVQGVLVIMDFHCRERPRMVDQEEFPILALREAVGTRMLLTRTEMETPAGTMEVGVEVQQGLQMRRILSEAEMAEMAVVVSLLYGSLHKWLPMTLPITR
jgi:hypothetical protein